MPIKYGKDKKGNWVRWGKQKKYYYSPKNSASRRRAVNKAKRQARAVRASGYKG